LLNSFRIRCRWESGKIGLLKKIQTETDKIWHYWKHSSMKPHIEMLDIMQKISLPALPTTPYLRSTSVFIIFQPYYDYVYFAIEFSHSRLKLSLFFLTTHSSFLFAFLAWHVISQLFDLLHARKKKFRFSE
jgi:hypothetical protein